MELNGSIYVPLLILCRVLCPVPSICHALVPIIVTTNGPALPGSNTKGLKFGEGGLWHL